MPFLPALVIVLGLLATGAAAAAPGYEAIRQEQTCPKAKEPRSLRQTIVILDEAIVSADPEANQRWTRMVVEAADAKEASQGTLGARERLSILVARRDGSELVPLFVGCSPNLTAEEADSLGQNDSMLDVFIGSGAAAKRKNARDGFAAGIARALAQVQKRAADLGGQPVATGGLIRALQNAGRLSDLNHGLPRFLLITPFQIVDRASLKDVAGARERGFQMAEKGGLDFGRAEIYLAGAALGDTLNLEFARALILGAKGILAGVRSDGLPRFQPEPASLRIYAGFIDYVGQRTPMQIRLSATAQGDLVNAWIETTRSRSQATPLEGKMLCRGEACEMRGDGRFAQVWFPDPQGEPPDRAKLPFGGARNVELTTQGRSASGRVFDPKVLFVGDKGERWEELRFEIERVEDRPF